MSKRGRCRGVGLYLYYHNVERRGEQLNPGNGRGTWLEPRCGGFEAMEDDSGNGRRIHHSVLVESHMCPGREFIVFESILYHTFRSRAAAYLKQNSDVPLGDLSIEQAVNRTHWSQVLSRC
ncbi:hypothetical protein FPOAC1_005083 [Fusarium poae]|uniref:hypothetical protein n=1 Tax=Fusarium poae TaxID=36050 RepID=UPI001CE9E985|nr:hypothetical protein FPOAC1_005083 [Fusarium poae]KAG8671825.1 hypothetical protein FPOAC1_005083 [Fusarium poae]